MTDEVRHISVSQLNMIEKCGVQWEYRYAKGLKIPPGVALIRGRGVHQAVGVNLRQKIESEKDLPLDVVLDLGRDAVVNAFAGDVTFTEDEIGETCARIEGRTTDTVVAMTREHHQKIAPSLRPLAVERKIRVLANKTLKADLVGIVDLVNQRAVWNVEEEKFEAALEIRDLKTKSKTPSQSEADFDTGLTAYTLLEKAATGREIREVALDAVVETAAGNISSKTLRSVRTNKDRRVLVRRFQRALKVIESGIYTPARPTDWWCSEAHCGYWAMCPFAMRR